MEDLMPLRVKSKILLCIFPILLIRGVESNIIPTDSFPGHVNLVGDDVYSLFWKYDSSTITFEVHVKVLGWVGFGISPNGGMEGSDIVIGWVKNGSPVFHDRHGTGNEMPMIDNRQDWNLMYASETSTHTILKFKRNLVLCDLDDLDISADTMRIIYAYSNIDPSSNTSVPYHNANRGVKSIMLLTLSSANAPSLPADAFPIDFRNPPTTIPNKRTTYWCTGFDAPSLSGKNHLIKIDPLIQAGNEAYVHHILLYACFHGLTGTADVSSTSFECYQDNHNMPWDECTAPITAWAIGAGSFSFPEHVGMPFGEVAVNRVLHLRMETHYDNPSGVADVRDESGLRLWFTPTLRQYDAGFIQSGIAVNSYTHFLPGGYNNLVMHGHCSEDCLSEAMGSTVDGIKIFAVGLHTHLLGRSVRVRQHRNGVEKPYIDQDLHYDFDFQETRMIQEVTVEKGDGIVVECTYNTSGQDHTVVGGLGTNNEMCLAFLYYYPALPLTLCESVTTQTQMAKGLSLDYIASFIPGAASVYTSDGVITPFHQYMGSLGKITDGSWKSKYQAAILKGWIGLQCGKGRDDGLSVHNKIVEITEITELYNPPCTCEPCPSPAGAAAHVASNLMLQGCLILITLLLVIIMH